ncbi:LIC_12708 family protein [Treponema sp.]|uniref:LIC_12708 family protein n=1 Tax=Treponema sp. TaxID=166 RepID=UPI003F0C2B50
MKLVKKILFSVVIAAVFLGCRKGRVVSSVEKENIFNLNYGTFEDELNVFNLGSAGNISISIAMRDGFFYILNGESNKIMEMNSYGDLLSLYYNPQKNPFPSFAESGTDVNSTRVAVPYAFNEISKIAVDSRKYLYAVDKLPFARQETDSKTSQVLSQVIVRFDGAKKYMNYIGQQGPGGTPFPYIKDIFTTDRNELVVLCTTSSGSVVYWFSMDGFLMYTIPIEKENVPNPFADEKTETFFSVENIVPDYRERKLYLKVDYFSSYIDESSRVQSGVEYVTTLIHTFDVENNQYDFPITIPPYDEPVSEGFSKENYEIPYDFLGITDSGWLYFIVSTENGFSLQMVQENGQRILKRKISLDRESCLYYSFNLSREGIISAIVVENEKASVCWWRIDSLIQAVIKN